MKSSLWRGVDYPSAPWSGATFAFKEFPRTKTEASMSTALNKFFRETDLFLTPEHKIHSSRHIFEDRLKDAGIDEELRRISMRHAIDRSNTAPADRWSGVRPNCSKSN
jgi:hypothetical protein